MVDESVTGPPGSTRRPFNTRWRLVMVVAAVAVGAVVGAGVWLFTPRALTPVRDRLGMTAAHEQPVMMSGVVDTSRPIEIVSVRPVTEPPEGVTISFVACRWHDPQKAFGTASGPLDEYCAQTRPVAGLRLEHREPRTTRDWDVLLIVELGDQTSFVTEGFVVTYREGLRRGRQSTGTSVAVYRPGHEPEDWLSGD